MAYSEDSVNRINWSNTITIDEIITAMTGILPKEGKIDDHTILVYIKGIVLQKVSISIK